MEKSKILSELKDLIQRDEITFEDAEKLAETHYHYRPISHYLKSLLIGSKIESATSELFKEIIRDVLDIRMFTEVHTQSGFPDFQIQESYGNPVLIELKALYTVDKDKGTINANEMRFHVHEEQVKKYLEDNDYVILMNMRHVYLFNRDAIFRYAPFYITGIIPFLEEYLVVRNVWDYLRRIEGREPRRDLDIEFFDDLKRWYRQLDLVKIIEKDGLSKEELIVLLINKMIFIKTLEDFSLIPFKYLEETYLSMRRRWAIKNDKKGFDFFFAELEEWFYEFYNTELFSKNFWNYVETDQENIEKFINCFEIVLGLRVWQERGESYKGIIQYNYRQIDEDVFGKAYETFIAENKKDSGIYYTPQPITKYMAERLVQLLFGELSTDIIQTIRNEDFETAQTKLDQLTQIKIVDPSSGSGSFLIKTLREIYAVYVNIKNTIVEFETELEEKQVDIDFTKSAAKGYRGRIGNLRDFRQYNRLNDPTQMISRIILNHIFAVDIDERALETAKTNIWKEAIKIEPMAFRSIRLVRKEHILPNLEMNFIRGDSLVDYDIDKEIAIIHENFRDNIVELHKMRNDYINDPESPQILDRLHELKQPIFQRLKADVPEFERPLFFPLEFFYVYFDETGQPLERKGFDGIITNPPWETIKPIRKEFAVAHKAYQKLGLFGEGKYSLDIKEFNKRFAKTLKKDKNFRKDWNAYKNFYRTYSKYLRDKYDYQGSGDLNYYKLFVERDLQLIKDSAFMTLLIPSGIQTDYGTSDLRKLIFENYRLMELYSFENKGYDKVVENNNHEANSVKKSDSEEEETEHVKLFPDVHPQFKFSIFMVKKEPVAKAHFPGVDKRFKFSIFTVKKELKLPSEFNFNAKFYLRHPQELYTPPINYNLEMIKNFSPDNLSIMEFKTETDYLLCSRICDENTILGKLDFTLRTEFHMTNDSQLFKKRRTQENDLILYEGKMVHQYDCNFSSPRYYINEDNARKELMRKELYRIHKIDKSLSDFDEQDFEERDFGLDYQTYRLVYRAVASSTNERSLIGTLIPPNSFIGHSMNYFVNFSYEMQDGKLIQKQADYGDLLYLLGLFNSLTLNYYIRNKISANLTMNFVYELPIAPADEASRREVIQKVFSLLVQNDEDNLFDELGKMLKIDADTTKNSIDLRAELEVYIAKQLYNMSFDEWENLTSSFIYGSAHSGTKQDLDAIIQKTKEIFES